MSDKIEALEAKLSSLYRSQDAATWGEEQECEASTIAVALHAAYEAAGTPDFDRMAL